MLKPDVIYALLNWQAVPFCHEVLKANPGIPFVWHYKEGPFISLEKGHWNQMVDLYARGGRRHLLLGRDAALDGVGAAGDRGDGRPTMVLDGDLPKQDWFDGRAIAAAVGAGRRDPHGGAGPADRAAPAHGRGTGARRASTCTSTATSRRASGSSGSIKRGSLAPRHLHLHANVSQDRWLAEFSQYDAGWLHFFRSENHGRNPPLELGRPQHPGPAGHARRQRPASTAGRQHWVASWRRRRWSGGWTTGLSCSRTCTSWASRSATGAG